MMYPPGRIDSAVRRGIVTHPVDRLRATASESFHHPPATRQEVSIGGLVHFLSLWDRRYRAGRFVTGFVCGFLLAASFFVHQGHTSRLRPQHPAVVTVTPRWDLPLGILTTDQAAMVARDGETFARGASQVLTEWQP